MAIRKEACVLIAIVFSFTYGWFYMKIFTYDNVMSVAATATSNPSLSPTDVYLLQVGVYSSDDAVNLPFNTLQEIGYEPLTINHQGLTYLFAKVEYSLESATETKALLENEGINTYIKMFYIEDDKILADLANSEYESLLDYVMAKGE